VEWSSEDNPKLWAFWTKAIFNAGQQNGNTLPTLQLLNRCQTELWFRKETICNVGQQNGNAITNLQVEYLRHVRTAGFKWIREKTISSVSQQHGNAAASAQVEQRGLVRNSGFLQVDLRENDLQCWKTRSAWQPSPKITHQITRFYEINFGFWLMQVVKIPTQSRHFLFTNLCRDLWGCTT